MKTEIEEKNEMLKKRIEYGKQMSSLNKFNAMCLERKRKSATSLKQDFITKAQSSTNLANFSRMTRSESVNVMSPVETHYVKTIELTLNKLKLCHENDKEIVEKIRASLTNLR